MYICVEANIYVIQTSLENYLKGDSSYSTANSSDVHAHTYININSYLLIKKKHMYFPFFLSELFLTYTHMAYKNSLRSLTTKKKPR